LADGLCDLFNDFSLLDVERGDVLEMVVVSEGDPHLLFDYVAAGAVSPIFGPCGTSPISAGDVLRRGADVEERLLLRRGFAVSPIFL
jgi:hypothetical protein